MGRSDRAAFATVVLTTEPLGTAARSIKRKIFSLSPTIFSNRELTVVCGCAGFVRMGAKSQLTSKDEPSCSNHHLSGDNPSPSAIRRARLLRRGP